MNANGFSHGQIRKTRTAALPRGGALTNLAANSAASVTHRATAAQRLLTRSSQVRTGVVMTSFALAFTKFKKLAHGASMYWDAFCWWQDLGLVAICICTRWSRTGRLDFHRVSTFSRRPPSGFGQESEGLNMEDLCAACVQILVTVCNELNILRVVCAVWWSIPGRSGRK